METPGPVKENECEKQLLENMEPDEFQVRNLMSEFSSWRRKIKPLYEVLGIRPEETPFQKLILYGANSEYFAQLATGDLIPKCQDLYSQLTQQVQAKKNEANLLWSELQGLWNELETKEEFGLCFTNAESGVLRALNDLKAQYNARKVEKSRKLSEFIGELRQEISYIWDQCMITEEEKSQFAEFESYEFTEEMLQIHKEELEKWKIYHKKNHEILLKIQKRDAMWKRLRELEAKASDPSRFVNRGGSLLKDQNMHNYLMKNLPKLEAELISLAQKFENEHGKKMRIVGEEIPVMIEKEWQQFKEYKSGKKSRTAPSPVKSNLNSIRRSVAPSSAAVHPIPMAPLSALSANPPLLPRPGDKRFGSKLDLNNVKRAKVQPLKPVQQDQ